MPSKPPPGSTGGSPRIPAPFHLAPDSTAGTPRTPAPFQPGSTGGSSRTPAALSAQATRLVTKKCIVLVDWCLERVEGEEDKICVYGAMYNPQKRHLLLHGLHTTLNIPKTLENGFSQEVIATVGLQGLEFWKVCDCFQFGFPKQWQSVVNPNMVPDNEHAQSPSETTTGAPSHSVEYYMKKLLRDSSIPYDFFTKNDSDSAVGYSGNADGLDSQQKNMHSCSSEHGMVTLPKSGKDSVNLGTTDALELPTEGMTPKFGAIRGSEDSTGRRLRSGKVLGMPCGGPMKRGHKQKEIHPEASSKQMVNQGTTSTSTADLTSHENDFSAAEVVAEEKLESHDSCCRGRGRPAKRRELTARGGPAKGKGKRKRDYLFMNWV